MIPLTAAGLTSLTKENTVRRCPACNFRSGSQGDIWDAQKDILADTFGALFALLLFALVRPDLNAHRAMGD
ncbi:MAG: hypothetical protein KJN79_07035 [Gammaproteobacteria bacterium]|nr:hypothetical protein [Gammaproteobacteria bacterium]